MNKLASDQLKVAVVIPTTGRHTLSQAVQSVLEQTYFVSQVIVVADVDDSLSLPTDDRITILRSGPKNGGNHARQSGIEYAQSDLIGLLDDDDWWEPDRLEVQLRELAAIPNWSPDGLWIASCSVSAEKDGTEPSILPEQVIKPSENYAEHMFQMRHLRLGRSSFLQSSTFLFPTTIGQVVPFRRNIQLHQDFTWLLDLRRQYPALEIHQSTRALVHYRLGSPGITRSLKWLDSVEWGRVHLRDESARTIGDFMLSYPIRAAAQARSLSGLVSAFVAGLRAGKPSALAYIHATAWAGVTALRILQDHWIKRG